MTPTVEVLEAGPAVSIQDLGRSGYIAQGLTQGGAMDRLAICEAAALLGQPVSAALEMVGLGGTFRSSIDLRIAVTGAPMTADIGGQTLEWHGSHLLPAGEVLRIGGVRSGAIGYLSFGGGIDTTTQMGSRSAHLASGIGAVLAPGDIIPLGSDSGGDVGAYIVPQDRFSGGDVGIVASFQSHLFGDDTLQRFEGTRFHRDARANRQGIRLNPDGPGFAAEGGLRVVSEIITTGDIQVTGDGAPYVLMCESQTTGGYPRVATVVPSDLPRVAQAPLGSEIRFRLLTFQEARAQELASRVELKSLASKVAPRVRDPLGMSDLLSYSLISGAVSAHGNFYGDET